MKVKKIKAIIERAKDGYFSAYCESYPFSGSGETAAAAKDDMLSQMKFFKEVSIEDNYKYPSFLDSDYEVVYTYDVCSILNYYSGILSLSGIEKITGVNQKQLWRYLNGIVVPRQAQKEKILKGLRDFATELSQMQL